MIESDTKINILSKILTKKSSDSMEDNDGSKIRKEFFEKLND